MLKKFNKDALDKCVNCALCQVPYIFKILSSHAEVPLILLTISKDDGGNPRSGNHRTEILVFVYSPQQQQH
jgi:hypothetical protein